jgi:hypothetical protein
MRDVQPDGDIHGPGDQVSPTLKVAKSARSVPTRSHLPSDDTFSKLKCEIKHGRATV